MLQLPLYQAVNMLGALTCESDFVLKPASSGYLGELLVVTFLLITLGYNCFFYVLIVVL